MRGSVWLAGIAASLLAAGLAAAPAARAVASTQSSSGTPASTLYVFINGAGCDDSGPGTQAEPFCTIQAAANVVQAGQTVEVRSGESGPVGGPVTISSKGTAAEPISFVYEQTPDLALLSPGTQASQPAVRFDGAQYVTFSSFDIQAYSSSGDGIDVDGSSNITLENLTMTYGGTAGISIDGSSSNVTIERSQLFGIGLANGIAVAAGASGVVVTTNRIDETDGSGITLDNAANSVLTSNTVLAVCTGNSGAGNGIMLLDGSSGTVENNVIEARANTGCPTSPAGLVVDSASAANVTTGYNAFFSANSANYSWAGTPYSTVQAFQVPGQGTNDVDLSASVSTVPSPNSQAVDSANCAAPDELGTDLLGQPRVRDPLATDASLSSGTCYADRGAYELQDSLPIFASQTPQSPQGYPVGAVPLDYGLTVAAPTTSPWGEAITYSVDFGDGSTPVTATPGTPVAHVYTTPEKYTITVTATDTGGSSSSKTYTAEAASASPLPVHFTAAPSGTGTTTGIWPDAVDFTASWGPPSWEVTSAIIAFGDELWTQGTNNGDSGSFSWYHVYDQPGTYTATVILTDVLGRTSTAYTTITVGDELQATLPRADYTHAVAAHGTVKIPLSVLTDGAQARGALVNVDVSDNDKTGTVIVYPNGTTRPDLATVQFQAGHPAENSTLATGGTVDFYNDSTGSIFLNVSTFGVDDFLTQAGGGLGDTYAPVTPAQVLPRTELPPEHKTVFSVTALDGVPANADAVVLDVTESGAAAPGLMLTYGERKGTQFEQEAAYWAKGQQVTGLATAEVSGGRVILLNDSKGDAYFTADVVGYYLYGGSNAVFLPATPDRLLKVTVAGKHWVKVAVAGRDGIPAASASGPGTTAAMVTLTAAGPTANGSFTVYADGTRQPANVTSLSYTSGQVAATAAIVQVGKDGEIDLYNAGSKPVLAVVDVDGSFYAY